MVSLLPLSVADAWSNSKGDSWFRARYVTRRYIILFVVVIAALSLALRAVWIKTSAGRALAVELETPEVPAQQSPQRLPPLYSQFHAYELELPQHKVERVPGESKYFWLPGHGRWSGWGNIMEELVFNAYLAYRANRIFVFDNYTWNPDGPDYSDWNGHTIPSRIPLTALLQGPIAGGPFPVGGHAQRAVVPEYFHQVCAKKTMISRGEVHDALPSNPPADVIIDKWLEKLNSIDDPCVEIVEQSGVLFDFWLFGSQGSIENIWDSFSSSPIMTHFGWSPLVELAFDTNRDLIHPTPVWEPFLSTQPFRSNIERYTMLHGLLVLHVRRGDYQDHCDHLAKWSSSYMSFNTFPDIPDRFSPPEGGGWGENTPENMDIYLSHCFPSIEQIVAKVESVRTTDAAAGLQNIYIMTNGAVPWVQELKDALKKSGHFTSVTSSRDMVLNWEQKYVAQAVDMLIGQRAQAFIGNGFSSMTSNINMLRMANKFRRDSIHFW